MSYPISANTSGQSAAQLAADQNQAPSKNTDPFWQYSEIQSHRWNESWPFQLLVVQTDNRFGSGAGTGAFDLTSTTYQIVSGWKFTLPIPPTDLRKTMPFAIELSVLSNGIVEEHNGAPLKMISFSGTTGVSPLRPRTEQATSFTNFETIFAGTVLAADQTAGLAESLTGNTPRPNLVPAADYGDGTNLGKSTGYYQMQLLERFLESYAAIKKTKAGLNYRLALAMWKDNAVYLVTPVVFNITRTASQALSYAYDLQFKAFKRVEVNGGSAYDQYNYKPAAINPSAFQKVLNGLDTSRKVLQGASKTLASVLGDTNTIFEPLRQVVLFCKDALGLETTAADLPGALVAQLKVPVLDALSVKTQAKQVPNILSQGQAKFNDGVQQLQQALVDLASSTYPYAPNSPVRQSKQTQSISIPNQQFNGAHPGHAIFARPEDHFDFFSAVKPATLRLPFNISKQIAAEKARVRTFTRIDFEQIRHDLKIQVLRYGDAVGAGSATLNRVYGLPPPVETNRTPTEADYEVMYALNEVVSQLARLAVSAKVNPNRTSVVEYVAALANRAGMTFKLPQSKYAVPYPYGTTLERLAQRYLKDPDRWIEIAALNNLESPYVDEEGFDLPLLSNGAQNQVVVAEQDRLFIGQAVWISSVTVLETKRHITNIETIDSTHFLVTLDGALDLQKYSIVAQAKLHTYLPNTVNSQKLIFIPSAEFPGDSDYEGRKIPGLDYYDNLLNVGGVDLLLTSDGDLAMTPDGDVRLAVGLANIVQRIRIALSIPRGSLIRHPEFGFAVKPGTSTADLSAKDILQSVQSMFGRDPTFTGISSVAISKVGPTLSVSLAVDIAGTTTPIPVSVDIKQ